MTEEEFRERLKILTAEEQAKRRSLEKWVREETQKQREAERLAIEAIERELRSADKMPLPPPPWHQDISRMED